MPKAMSEKATPVATPAPSTALVAVPPKYSSRVAVLKTLLESGGAGGASGLVGRRVVVGGWVRSSKEVKKEAPQPPVEEAAGDVSCSEILQSRIPFIRTIIKILGGSSCSVRDKLEASVASPTPWPPISLPSTAFLQVSDGSCASSLLVVVESAIAPINQLLPTGTCIVVEGELKESSMDAKHVVELKAEKLLHIGSVESDKYPLSKKRLPLNSLRDFPHLRPRTTTVATVMRIRSGLSLAVHAFSQHQGFLSVQLPIITATDSEGFGGAGDKFHVATARDHVVAKRPKMADDADGLSLEGVRAAVKEKSMIVEELRRSESNKEALVAAARDLQKTAELAARLEARDQAKEGGGGGGDGSFFHGEAHLTASGRLHLESFACSMGNVYAFGPRFRANRNESPKHVAEMWMVEMEMAFSQLEDAINCAEDLFRFLCKWILEKCYEDMKFVVKRMDRISVDRLQSVVSNSIERITYNEALDALKKATENKKLMETKIEWGISLTTEHLSYLVEEVYKRPVIIYNYPKQVKPFFARLNDDRRTVAAFDLVVPKIGILISGSQNEERLNMLNARIKELGLAGDDYDWYLDLRRHGTVKHAGFSFAFDLMVLFATGLADVRDVIPFPRTQGKLIN